MTQSNRQTRRKWLIPSLIALLLATAALLAGGHILDLDRTVRERLAGRIWALPAEVYARPLEIYPGLPLNPQNLADELELSGYRLEERPSAAGSYSRNGGSFEIVTRDFPYSSGIERSEHFTLVIAADRVTALHRTATAEAIPLVRIDPARIGAFHALEYEDRLLHWHILGRARYDQGAYAEAVQFFLKAESRMAGSGGLARTTRQYLEAARSRAK